MINLIPKEDLEKIKTEYFRRVVLVCGIVLTLGISFASLLILPVYFSLNPISRELEAREEIAKKTLSEQKTEESLKKIRQIEERARQIILSERKRPSPFLVTSEIAKSKNEGIAISNISYKNNNSSEEEISFEVIITGVAKKRENLVDFASKLKNNPRFKQVETPIISFLKSEKADFQITLKTNL